MSTPTVDQLLEELTVDIDSESFIEEITRTELPPTVEFFARQYDETIGTRDAFGWKWFYRILDYFTLETVPEDRIEEIHTVKTLFTMFIVILDDLAEDDNDRATFEQARTIPFSVEPTESPMGLNQPALSLAGDIWSAVSDRLAGLSRYSEFITVLAYDLRQSITAMDYSLLVNESPAVGTRTGTRHYGPHNMCFFPYIDMDLMASPSVMWADVAPVREIYWTAQQMGWIGNGVTTWEREVHEGDVSSGVVVAALRDGVVTPEQLQTDPEATIAAIEASEVEATLIERWHTLHAELRDVEETATSVDLDRVADRMERVLAFQLAAEGYK